MKNLVNVILVLGFLLSILGCRGGSSNSNVRSSAVPASTPSPIAEAKPLVDIPQLANKSPEEFEKVLGQATQIAPIKNNSEFFPGEYRDYKLPNLTDTLLVRFQKGKAVHFVLTVPKEMQTNTPEELAKLAGFNDLKNGEKVGVYAVAWEGNFKGVQFEEIKVINSNNDNFFNLTATVQ